MTTRPGSVYWLDQPDGDGIPKTMAAYDMRGTPTMLVFDRAGRLRRHYFGRPDDIMVTAEIMAIATEDPESPREQATLIERKIAAILQGEVQDHGSHDHDTGHVHGPGCGHDHGHEGHVHGPGCNH